MLKPTLPFASVVLLLVLPGLSAMAGDQEATRTKQDLDAFRGYLKKEHPNKKWQQGPTRLDSAALRTAYGERRFYYVYSSPPLPPGANIKSVQEAYRRRAEDIRKNYLALTVRIDAKGQVVPVKQPQDYNDGLMKVASDADARTAAAAILSLHQCAHVAPAAVDPRIIVVAKSEKGWSCRANGKGRFRGTVTLDAAGKCTGVSKSYAGPYPP
jgi:hypothetical protein